MAVSASGVAPFIERLLDLKKLEPDDARDLRHHRIAERLQSFGPVLRDLDDARLFLRLLLTSGSSNVQSAAKPISCDTQPGLRRLAGSLVDPRVDGRVSGAEGCTAAESSGV